MTINKDLLMTMPIEIQYSIFGQLSLQERIQLCHVCKLWQTAILNAPGTWKTLSLKIVEQKIEPNLQPYEAYIKRDNVKEIKIDGEICDTKVTDYLVSLKCNKLNDVYLKVGRLTRVNAFKLLDMCGPSLTRVILILDDYIYPTSTKQNASPDFFLRHCRNLKQFTFVGYIKEPEQYNPSRLLTNVKHQHLTDLSLEISNMYNGPGTLDFFKATPKLERLGISLLNVLPTANESFPEQLLQHCPELKTLHLLGEEDNKLEIRELHTITPIQYEQRGIAELYFNDFLYVEDDEPGCTNRILRPFIPHIHNTVQVLSLGGVTDEYDDNLMQYLSNFDYPSLKHLILNWDVLTAEGENGLHRFFQIIAGNLTIIEIKYYANFVDDVLLGLIATHAQHLECIEFTGGGAYTSKGLQQFLETMTHPQRTLRNLALDHVKQVDAHILHMISTSKLCVINDLKLLIDVSKTFVEDIERFLDDMVEAGKRMNFLHLTLSSIVDPGDFVESKRGKGFLKRLNTVASAFDLVVSSSFPHLNKEDEYTTIKITHDDYQSDNF
ncbi:hypothetical protein BDA99DRAFT_357169 [Phascolomyces articulosus]|uniref:F-box domain-containing protein n=1 Tax=Phascolomyces articulosus TaxID=60185 RepID=A0AAD5PFX5_9FUNG|nr:hypothetical protein BDA99DRAFT_357169 [Phascolomyces articulosus]